MKNYSAKIAARTLFVFATLIFGASQLLAKPPVKELVLYYPFTTVNDCSGNNNNGKASDIVASNSPSLVSMQQTRQLTIVVWIKPDSLAHDFPVVVSKGGNESPGAYGGYELMLNATGDNDLVFASGTCEITTHNANGRWVNNHLGEWIHVAFTINDDTKVAKFYVNGLPTNDEFDFGTYFNSTAN